MTTTYATVAPTTWGGSRRWNAYVEILVGDQPVASSASGDFALLGGTVTEDMSRAIRRDVSLHLQFPTGQRSTTVPVYTPLIVSTFFSVGSSTVGSSDTIGGNATGSPLLDQAGATITDQNGDPLYVGSVDTASTPQLQLLIPSGRALTTRSAFIPTSLGDLLDPNSQAIIRVWAGFAGEEALLGYFDLSSVPVRMDVGGPLVDVAGQSFERRLSKAGFWQVEAYTAGIPAWQLMESLVTEALPTTVFSTAKLTPTVSGVSYKPGDDRMAKITEVMGIAGIEGGFDRNNIFTTTPTPSTGDFGTAQPRWQVLDGINARVATLNGATRTFSDDSSYNGVVVEGTNHTDPNAAPVIYALWNTNAASPLYFDPANPRSGSGPRPKQITSDLVATLADARAMAQAELAKVLMVADTADAVVPANALIEMGHFARLASDGLGVDGIYRVTKVVHDLSGAPAQLSLTRFQQV